MKADPNGTWWRSRIWVWTLGLVICGPSLGGAQSVTTPNRGPEVFVSIGGGKVVYLEQTFRDVGGGVILRFRSGLALELEVNRTLELAPPVVPCPVRLPPVTCMGTLRSGMRRALTASANVTYFFFPNARVRPYVSGGGGGFSQEYVYISGAATDRWTALEGAQRSLHLTVGGGVGVSMTRALSLRPEFRYYYSEGFRITRASVAAGYQW